MCIVCEMLDRRQARIDAFEDKHEFGMGAVLASTNDPDHFEAQLRLLTSGHGLEDDEALRLWKLAHDAVQSMMIVLVANPRFAHDVMVGTVFESLLQGLTLAQVIRERESQA
jgi:hypothetical protein